MNYPALIVNLKKLRENCENIVSLCREKNISVTGITKSVFNDLAISETMLNAGCVGIGESRISNLKKIVSLPCEKLLTRVPLLSEIEDVIKFSDISLNSEFQTIKALNSCAKKEGKRHKIFLLLETGDFRDGEILENIYSVTDEILKLKNIEFLGIASNMGCLSDSFPTLDIFNQLLEIRDILEKKSNLKLWVSAGNSSFLNLLPLIEKQKRVTLRIGEGLLLGRDTVQKKTISGSFDDVFLLESEIIELKIKRERVRGVLAIGYVEINLPGLQPLDSNIILVGATSDHTIIEFKNNITDYKLGDRILFKVDYWTLLKIFSLPDVNKIYIQ
ncbi:MAG: alanine racemase [Fusobacteriaceae bacterium]